MTLPGTSRLWAEMEMELGQGCLYLLSPVLTPQTQDTKNPGFGNHYIEGKVKCEYS